MILNQLNCDNIIFEELSSDSNNISIITRPKYELEIDENFNSNIYTSKDIKTILIQINNNIPDDAIVPIPFNQWTNVIKIKEEEYRLAGIDLGVVSLHFMVLIENQTSNEIYLYTGDFFTIEKLDQNDFFKENLPKLKKIFFDNKIIKYDLNTYMDIISTFIVQKIDTHSFAICLPPVGYEDFIAVLISKFNMSIHVNELRKALLQKSEITKNATFVDRDGPLPKLIIHKKSKTISEIRKLYYNHKICSLSFSHLNEFTVETPKINDYYLTMLQWDQHPTEPMVLELFQMLAEHTAVHFIYDSVTCSNAILQYVCASALIDSTNDLNDDELFDLDITCLNTVEETQNLEFSPQYCSSQLPPNGTRFPMPIEVNPIINEVDVESVETEPEDNDETNNGFCIEDYQDLDLGHLIKYLRYIGKPNELSCNDQ